MSSGLWLPSSQRAELGSQESLEVLANRARERLGLELPRLLQIHTSTTEELENPEPGAASRIAALQ
jgi:hypothetical protein